MSIASEFRELIESRPSVNRLIDEITPTEYGCSYRWDGFMTCHIVFERGKYVDVQDRIDPFNLEPGDNFTRYDSVLSLVLAMEDMINEHS
jgi:hypothetical protein